MDKADAHLRIAMLMERVRRAFKLPLSPDATVEERLAEVERLLTDLHALVYGLAIRTSPDQAADLERIEESVLRNEQRRGIVPEA